MAEWSQPWPGTTVGDATRAPYSDDEWDDMFECLFASTGDAGVLFGYDEGLMVTQFNPPAANWIVVQSGAALVKGKLYRNTSDRLLGVSSPAVATRRDWVILRSCWNTTGCGGGCAAQGAQTIRLVVKQNPDEDLTPPALTQVDGDCWEIPLAQIDINTAGSVIAFYDMRVPISPFGIFEFIPPLGGRNTTDGTDISITMQDNGTFWEPVIVLPDNKEAYAIGRYALRQGYVQLGGGNSFTLEVLPIVVPQGTGNIRCDQRIWGAKCGGANAQYGIHDNIDQQVATGMRECIYNYASGAPGSANAEAGDVITLDFRREGNHASDTVGAAVWFIGWIMYGRALQPY